MNLFRVSDEYIRYLKTIDGKILNNVYENRNRPYCGIVLNIETHNYFAPISSYKPSKHDKIKNHTIFKVYGADENEKLAVVHLNNMFPIIESETEWIDFNKEEASYKKLLEKEYSYLLSNQEELRKKSQKLYNDVICGKKFFVDLSCDFKLLEKEYTRFNKTNVFEKA